MSSVTITDVSSRAGVSVATVSRVFSGRDRVSPTTAARVRAVAAELGYRPNSVARGLRTKNTKTLALVIPDIAEPYFTALARGVERVANAADYSLMLCNTGEDAERERRHFDAIGDQRVAGLIVAPHSSRSDIRPLLDHGIPIVVVDRSIDAPVDQVMVRDTQGAYLATRHLIDEGWRRPAILTGPVGASTATARLSGYLKAVEESGGLSPVVVHSQYSEPGGKESALDLLSRDPRPDALLVANSTMAIGVLSAMYELGLTAGKDVGFVMFDDPSWARYFSPRVSAVVQPSEQIGEIAAQLLLEHVGRHATDGPRLIELETELVLRESSRRQPAA